ncbi:MAG TPA: hypothetical protein VJ924_00245 [Alphaproteobacteria bacterium]|nr:hypothetical protein [Alphaproteobacteria bacterium]
MIIKRNGTLTTATTLNPNNVWSGSAFEYLKGPAIIAIGLMSPTTFALSGLLSACYVGATLVAEEYIVPNIDPAIFGRNNAIMANDFYIQAGGMGGDRIVNTLRNPTAGTLAYDAIAMITPVGGGRRR